MSESTKAVFLSYASQDVEAATLVCEALREQGMVVWFDQNELRGGDAWDRSIRDQIRDCALFIALISANTDVRSEGYFRLEWKLAVDRSHLMADDQPFLLPVVVDDTHEATARVPNRFRERQWTRLPGAEASHGFAKHVQRLLSGTRALSTLSEPMRRRGAVANQRDNDNLSLAVLPFVNMSDDRENEYFSDGVMEEILTNLSKISALHVISRTSAMTYKGTSKSIREIAGELGVGTVLEGSVRKAGNRVRVTAQLIDAASDKHLWSEQYDRDLDDIFAVQSDVSLQIAGALRAKLSPDLTARIKQRPTDSLEAYQLYLKGRAHYEVIGAATYAPALEAFELAVGIDPDYAQAHAGIAHVYCSMSFWGAEPAAVSIPKARRAVERALALNPTLGEAHAIVGLINATFDIDWEASEAAYTRAEELSPQSSLIPFYRGVCRCFARDFAQAIPEIRRAQQLDPLSATINSHVVHLLLFAGRIEEAEQEHRRLQRLHADYWFTDYNSALIAWLRNDGPAAIAAFETVVEKTAWVSDFLIAWLCAAHHRFGSPQRAAELYQHLRERSGDLKTMPVSFAFLLLMRGESEQGMAWLSKAHDAHDAQFVCIWMALEALNVPIAPEVVAKLIQWGVPEESTGRGQSGSS